MWMIWMSRVDRVSVTGSSSTPPSCHQHNTLSLPPVTSLSVGAGIPCKYIQIYRVSQPYYHYHQQAALPAGRVKMIKIWDIHPTISIRPSRRDSGCKRCTN